jgi:hypothetical protein
MAVAERVESGDLFLSEAIRRAAELALVSEVAGALVGPLLPPEIATAFLQGVSSVLHPEATAMFLLYDELKKTFHSIAAKGPDAGDFADYTIDVLPDELRTLLMDQREALLLPDTTQAAVWPDLTAALPNLAHVRARVHEWLQRDRHDGTGGAGNGSADEIALAVAASAP